MAWLTKGFKGPPFSIIYSFYKQKVLVALYRFQATIILRQAIVVIGEASFRLGVLLGFWRIFLQNLFHDSGDGFRS
jgi:hypothetical protein